MSRYLSAYVFISGDRKLFALTVDEDGMNLPARAGNWKQYDVIPLTTNYLCRYTADPDHAHVDLITHGYYLTPTRRNIVPFLGPERS